MGYKKQNFTDGQVLKAEHLNYIEAAIEDISDGIAEPTDEQVFVSVQAWLDKHPEAITGVTKENLSLGQHTDGKIYIFVDGEPVGMGLNINNGSIEPVPATGIVLDTASLTVEYGEAATLIATVTPSNTTDKAIWESSDENVAIVSNGVVTWNGVGECTITITAGDVSASCAVLCRAEPTAVMSNFKYLGPTTYSPGTYTAWCPTGLIYDETRDVYAHFITVRGSHYDIPDKVQLWFNTIDPDTLEHTKPVFVADGAENVSAGGGYTGTVIKNGVYYAFSEDFGYYKSEDGGKTWTHHDYITAPDGVWGCYVLPNGRMIMGSDAGATATHINYSDDNGATWVKVQTNSLFDEPTFVPFGGGKVMAIIRYQIASSDPLARPYMRISEDYGETWSDPVAMQTAGYMNANNCNAFVHDGIIELFVGCRIPKNNSAYTEVGGGYEGVTYAIDQYQMDMSLGMVDCFTHVARVYEYKAADNDEGLTTTDTNHFSTPCIAIKAKDNGICMFYKPRGQGVTQHLIAMSNTTIARSYVIPDIFPETYNARQVFSGNDGDYICTVCGYVYGTPQITYGNWKNYPYFRNGAYLDLSDTVDGGFVHIRGISVGSFDFPPFVSIADGKLLCGYGDTMRRAPIGSFTGDLPTKNAVVDNWQAAMNGPGGDAEVDVYGLMDNGRWWYYYDGSWWRQDVDNFDLSANAKTEGYDNAYLYPYNDGLTDGKFFVNSRDMLYLKLIEYDKVETA